MLNCMLYFVVYVSNRLNHTSFEQDVRRRMSGLYIENKMRIRMHDYSYAISKAIGHDVMECVHIIYYLIYGRFASTAYVSMISQNKDQQHKGLLWKKSLSSCGETSTALMSPQIEKKISWNYRTSKTDLDVFSQEL
jgi:hypothetical protein